MPTLVIYGVGKKEGLILENVLKVCMIGLDTSHSIEFARRVHSPDLAADLKVEGMKIVSCMRFSTPFLSAEDFDTRQKQLEDWGIKVTKDFDEAVADCDAIMLEINDPAYHLEYFKKCADLGKPIFVDKPLADSIENGKIICKMAEEKNIRMFSCSSLRFSPQLEDACDKVSDVKFASTYGTLGDAPAGSSVVWYGVHAFEMLNRAMGNGAISVFSRKDNAGVVSTVEYANGKRGVVELTDEVYFYGGCLRNANEDSACFIVKDADLYTAQLRHVLSFFKGEEIPVDNESALEVMAMLDAAERSTHSGKAEKL